jgi:thiol-disulfide isomerase/thioredoxin
MQAKRLLLRCLLCAALTASLAAQDVHRDFTVEEGEREAAPRFHAKSLDGAQFTNESTKGKVVLLQFWTTWCPYCKSEETMVNNLTTEFADKGLLVLAVDVAESKKVVQQYLKDDPRKCHIVMTGDTNLAAMYAATRYPVYVLVDRDGKIVDTKRGAVGDRSLRRLLARAGLESKDSE